MLLGVVGFLFLWRLRKKDYPDGKLFMIYLMLASLFRFVIEFLRLNPRFLFGLSEAQLIGIVLCCVGLIGMFMIDKKHGQAGTATP